MINRIKQVINYIFKDVKDRDLVKVKLDLSQVEYDIFLDMDKYDQIHSIELYKKVIKDKILGENKLYRKLALLHDCGKKQVSLFRRIKHVLVSDEMLETHPYLSYKKLKRINLELAELATMHHSHISDKLLKRFQELDDIS